MDARTEAAMEELRGVVSMAREALGYTLDRPRLVRRIRELEAEVRALRRGSVEAQVRGMRERGMTYRAIARELGMSRCKAWRIANGRPLSQE